MQKIIDNPRLIYKCCKLYYEENRGQQEIADLLGVSRVSISRMLQSGRELGLVKIQIVPPSHLTYTEMEKDLERLYGLKEAVVVENSPLATAYDHLSELNAKAVGLLENYLHDNDVVGVSMGNTLHNVCNGTNSSVYTIKCTFVPIVGGISSGRSATMNVHSNQTAMNFARFFGGEYVEFFAPAIFQDLAVLKGFMNEAPMQSVLQYYHKVKTVIMGIGTPNRAGSTMIRAGYITQEQLQEMVRQGVVGDLSLQFFDKDGNTDRFREFNARVTGMPLRQLRKVENRICIGSGGHKAEAVHGAIRGGFINILVTDQECAIKLIKMGKEEKENE